MSKDKQRQKEGKDPRDKDGTWGVKGDKVVETEQGKKKKTESFYGHKDHKDQVSLNVKTELVTTVIPGYANDYDGHKLPRLVDKDLEKGIEIGTVAGDRRYDDGANHYYLAVKGINSAIRLNNYRTQKKQDKKRGLAEAKRKLRV